MIAFICPSCRKQLQVKDDFAGKRGTCPQCKQAVTVPGVEPAATARITDTPLAPNVAGEKLEFLAPPQAPGELGRLGPYRVLKVLGAGGMGMVLQAEDPHLKRIVALKVMKPELAALETHRKRFLREAEATAAVEHPYVVHIFQVGEDRGVPYLAMPFLKGEPLDVRLKREGKLPVAEAVRIARQVAEGLAAAHEQGLIHRDIKPANIWLEEKTRFVKILDFGLARATTSDDVHLTATGTILGTPAYMAPEQGKSCGVDHRCDLFSLGAVLYRMLTNEQPFKGGDTMALLLALATETPPPVRQLNPQVPHALSDLVGRLLEKEPANRPPTAQAVADALASFEDDAQRTKVMSSRSDTLVPRARAPRSLRPVILAGAGGVLLLFLCLALWLALRSGPAAQDSKPVAGGPSSPQKPPEPEKVVTNSVGMKLALIPAGEFLMGAPEDEPEVQQREVPQHRVKITKPFYLGVYEVKQSEYKKVIGINPSAWKEPDKPVENVNWYEAMEFCKQLSNLPAEKKAGRVYRLPTDAEWEYACRAGTTTPVSFGKSLSASQAAFNGEAPYNGGAVGAKLDAPVKVGQYKANTWGLYDMHGNVWEWCLDGMRPYAETAKPLVDPRGPMEDGGKRVLRGGAWSAEGRVCRTAIRLPAEPDKRTGDAGFRVLLER